MGIPVSPVVLWRLQVDGNNVLPPPPSCNPPPLAILPPRGGGVTVTKKHRECNAPKAPKKIFEFILALLQF